ncbi:MAG: leucyl aminopeptidase [Gemmatimonadetes bacterium]|nr:leucyl aminopeptidase [Gemmatimonadota bacterium]NNM05508.1 leucyl aminopeptidase [Gemmatimonadota bacterium]
MNVELILQDPLTAPSPLLVLPVFQGTERVEGALASADALTEGGLQRALDRNDITGKMEETFLFFPPNGSGPERILVVGIGKRGEVDAEVLRKAFGRAVRVAEGLRLAGLSVWMDPSVSVPQALYAQAATEGVVLAAWRFKELKTQQDPDQPESDLTDLTLISQGNEEEARRGYLIGLAQAKGENLARTLQARPGNVATPTHLGDEAKRLGREFGLKVTILGPKEMEGEGMGALLAVAQGSKQEPRFIVLEHRGGGKEDPPLVLVGKGLTFDAGGISIKPASGMEDMKFDMSGGAAVLGAMQAVAELALPMNVVGIVPSSENLLDGGAVKPGDVIRTREGKTVEVINTDAEGRLILADALSFAQTLNPAAMVDCATLTGACVIALGHQAAAVLGTDDGLVEEIREAGNRSGERCWPLPLWKEYREQLDSTVADMKNVGGRPAGTITAATFLKEFVGDVPWAHLDIAGTAYGDGKISYLRKGGYGAPTRTLLEWIRSRVA